MEARSPTTIVFVPPALVPMIDSWARAAIVATGGRVGFGFDCGVRPGLNWVRFGTSHMVRDRLERGANEVFTRLMSDPQGRLVYTVTKHRMPRQDDVANYTTFKLLRGLLGGHIFRSHEGCFAIDIVGIQALEKIMTADMRR
jgi:hypothetical protein